MPKAPKRRPDTVAVARGRWVRADGGEHAVPPSEQQAHREEDDERRDRGLRTLLDALGQEPLGQQDRHTEGDERDGVPETPPGAEPGR